MIAEYPFTVRWGDTDAAGIVYYPNFYKWMDEASHEYLGKIGYPSSKLYTEQHTAAPLLEAHCVFKTSLYFEDHVTVISEVVELHRKVFKISHKFYRDETLIAEGYEVRAWVTFKEKAKAYPIPDDVREKMMPEKVSK